MANIVIIEYINGDTLDINEYCSDWCAREDPNYQGWYGCVEADGVCENCGKTLNEMRVAREGAYGCGDVSCESCYKDVLDRIERIQRVDAEIEGRVNG